MGVVGTSHLQGCGEECPNGTSKVSVESDPSCQSGRAMPNPHILKLDSVHAVGSPGGSVITMQQLESTDAEQGASAIDYSPCVRKRQKLDLPQVEQSIAMEATESSVLNWLKNFEEGVSAEL